jgi:hypothetical protein
VIANFPITKPKRWEYVTEDRMTPEFFMEFARQWEDIGEESQALVIIDEAHRILNSRSGIFGGEGKERLQLLRFLSEHRHFGYDVILVAQSDRMLDRQARPLIEVEVHHLKLNQRFWWLPIPVFMRREMWYGMSGFKPKLDVAVWPIGRGRYDHLQMRKAMREAGRGLGGPPTGSVSVGRNGNGATALDHSGETVQVAQVGIDGQAVAQVAVPVAQAGSDQGDFVVGKRVYARTVIEHRRFLRS